MAKNAYVGVNNVAQKIKAMYVGVNGVARKITKGYVGVNGVAHQFYPTEKLIPFTSSPAPTSWSGSSTATNYKYEASNSYGSWTCQGNKTAYANTNLPFHAFDGNVTGTWARPSSSSGGYFVQIDLPTNIAIKPSRATVSAQYVQTNSTLRGFNKETGVWDTIYTFSTAFGSTMSTQTFDITTNNYYTAFGLQANQYGSQAIRIGNVQIVQGTIKDDR